MPPTARSQDHSPTPQGHPMGSRPVRNILIGLIVLVLISAGAAVVIGGRYINRLIETGRHAESLYADLEVRMPERPFDPDRYQAMLHVRQQLIAQLPTGSMTQLERVFTTGAADSLPLTREVLTSLPALIAAVEAHVKALEAEQMRPSEYIQLLHSLVQAAISEPGRYAAGAAYRRIDPDFKATRRLHRGLRSLSWVFPDPEMVDSLEADNPLAYVVDLLILSVGNKPQS